MAKSYEELVDEARSVTKMVTADELKTERDGDGDVTVLDVREKEERDEQRIPDSKFLPRGLLEYKAADELPDRNARIVIHCAMGGRGFLSVQTLQEMGYTNVANLKGGIGAWREAGHPVEEG